MKRKLITDNMTGFHQDLKAPFFPQITANFVPVDIRLIGPGLFQLFDQLGVIGRLEFLFGSSRGRHSSPVFGVHTEVADVGDGANGVNRVAVGSILAGSILAGVVVFVGVDQRLYPTELNAVSYCNVM